jgi:hypothetical protein
MSVTRAVVAALCCAVVLGHARTQSITDAPAVEAKLVGLPIFTLDGARIGMVMEAGVDDGELIILAKIRGKRGVKMHGLVIPADLFVIKPDRLDILLTTRRINDMLGR